ncbi:MAG: chromosomal replication initiator protein DnaA, partial [Clostridia bacterium]|nr:chromosomal replication initiator protein DnaA [Clostridia bacterium]
SDYDPDRSELIFDVDSEFKALKLNERYAPLIEERFVSETGMDVAITFRYTGAPSDPQKYIDMVNGTRREPDPLPPTVEEQVVENAPRSRYTFENFIVGESNKFAHAACWKVANNPSTEWNPLFLYGPSGVGKTQLMCAVINEIRRRNPAAKVVYTKGDDFINDMVRCLANSDMESFRARYRSCDVLLIDDIQFVAGKEATQNEVFHTFQTLFEEGKQIILASDRPPKDIHPLEERLRSRFEQGLLADINPPDLELRVAIIRKKAEYINIDLPDGVLTFLAENLRSNIRQIEGAIKKLAAKALLDGRKISMEMARDCISDLLGDTEPLNVTIDKIFAVVYKKYNIPKEDIVGKKRNKEIAQARHIATYLIREVTEISFPNLAKVMDKDNATVQASCKQIKTRVIREPLFAAEVENMIKEIRGR